MNVRSFLLALILVLSVTGYAEEGMYPLSELKKLNLKKAGIQLTQQDIYNPNGISLVDALVSVSGCSGSFVSADGLIITNHHCAFGAVQAASSTENDYITNGFLAGSREQEIEARGITVRITVGYRDVSSEIVRAAETAGSPADRNKLISSKMAELVKAEETASPGIKAEVSEMFAGKTYVLFRYQTIRDVRLVYVPPRSIGEFGGESDNWVWPRHTGDFSFLRAYVGKNGEPAPYSAENVPFRPKKFLKVNAAGVKENDAVFILGYPGRTFRHQPAGFMEMQENFDLPVISELYEWQIRTMEAESQKDPAVAIKLAARIKSLANVMKNFKGKLKGLTRLELTAARQEEEKHLQAWIEADPARKVRFGTLIPEINAVYAEMKAEAPRTIWYREVYRSSTLLNFSRTLNELIKWSGVADSLRPSGYQTKSYPAITSMVNRLDGNLHLPVEKAFLKRLLQDALALPSGIPVEAVRNMAGKLKSEIELDSLVNEFFKPENLISADDLRSILSGNPVPAKMIPWMNLAAGIEAQSGPLAARREAWAGTLNKLLADYVEVKQKWKGEGFIPDANSTLRFTYGRVKGYSPADGSWYHPVTHLAGVLEKAADNGDYFMEKRLQVLYSQTVAAGTNMPVAVLYNTDTTGGNSGSPVLNAKGELVAVNFDRSFEATINDYNWNESYSRSMGVDIRYVLWVTEKVGGAGYLLSEMGVPEAGKR